MRYHIWTIGCQMNRADSERLAGELQRLGARESPRIEDADIVVLNSCVVRQSAEDKVVRKLENLKAFKRKQPHAILALSGCMVESSVEELKNRYPHVDFFLKPGCFDELLAYLRSPAAAQAAPERTVPKTWPTAYVPIAQGCNNFCSYCIVPYRRGPERSRPMNDIIYEIRGLARSGIKEVTLLGQNVDSYGHDLPGKPDLADLLGEVNEIDGLLRIRFLTSHPKDMSRKLIEAVASLDKVCEHISLPAQAGDDRILAAMRRGYSIEQYRGIVETIRRIVPGVAISNDVIVGFPDETDEQFQRTYDLLEDLRFDTVHIAMYSPRPGTIASRDLADNVPAEEKERRSRLLESLQERISLEKNRDLVGSTVEVLVEGRKGGKWQGRTRGDKQVFFSAAGDLLGRLVRVGIEHAGPWSLQGRLQPPL